MGVSLSSALWSPSLQAQSSLLMSPKAASPGCAARCIALGLNYTAAAPSPVKFPLLYMIVFPRILRLLEMYAVRVWHQLIYDTDPHLTHLMTTTCDPPTH